MKPSLFIFCLASALIFYPALPSPAQNPAILPESTENPSGSPTELIPEPAPPAEIGGELPPLDLTGETPPPLVTSDAAPDLLGLFPTPAEPLSEKPEGLTGDLPDPGVVPGDDSAPAAAPDTGEVPGSDLSPSPAPAADAKDPKDVKARGPIFRVRGGEAFSLARQRGFRFSPAQGQGRRDGNHTVASQVPNVLTSEVHGTRMMQMRPSPLWTTPYIENTFFMFCDAAYNAVKLQPGWKIRGIQLSGTDWQWVVCPRSGANTASFSIRIRSWKRPDAPALGSVVTLQGLTLEGPIGATDWKAAFPALNQARPLAKGR